MSQLVAYDIVCYKPRAVDHLRPVPEGIGAKEVAVIHGGYQRLPGIVQAVAIVLIEEEIIGLTGEQMRISSLAVARQTVGIALVTDQRAGQVTGVIGSKCCAVLRPLNQVDVQDNARGLRIDK